MHEMGNRVESGRVGAPEYAGNLDAIPWSHGVNQVIIGEERDRAGCLPLGDLVRCLLQADQLLVGEQATIVDNLERRQLLTGRALRRLFNAPTRSQEKGVNYIT